MPIKHFRELIAWQKSHALIIEVYHLLATFPQYEQYGLCSQMRRSAVSISSNIAEGFGRPTISGKQYFYSVAIDSLAELECQLILAKDLGYISASISAALEPKIIEVNKLIGAIHRGAVSSGFHSSP